MFFLNGRISVSAYEQFGTILKNVKSTHGGVTLLAKFKAATLLKVALLHDCFSRFLSCKNATKSRKASHIVKAWMLCKPCIWREALFLAMWVLTKLTLRRVSNTVNVLIFFSQIDFFFSDSEIQINLIVLGLQGSSSGYVSYCRILLFLLLIIIGSGITLLVMFKGDIGEVQKFLTKQFTNMMDFAQKKYKSLKSHVSWFKIANITK